MTFCRLIMLTIETLFTTWSTKIWRLKDNLTFLILLSAAKKPQASTEVAWNRIRDYHVLRLRVTPSLKSFSTARCTPMVSLNCTIGLSMFRLICLLKRSLCNLISINHRQMVENYFPIVLNYQKSKNWIIKNILSPYYLWVGTQAPHDWKMRAIDKVFVWPTYSSSMRHALCEKICNFSFN